MIVGIPAVLTPEEAGAFRARLEQAAWRDGAGTAGHLAARVKANRQLADDDPLAAELGNVIVRRLAGTPRFVATALPLKVLPPRFNCYAGREAYGPHIDSAVFGVPRTPERVRSDLSATLFLSEPDSYEGGELVAEFGLSQQRIKLPAGHLLLYPANTVHQVAPVTHGVRYAAFFWIQSLVRAQSRRSLLLELDESIQALSLRDPGDPQIVRLTGVYHNLLREWVET